MNEHTIPRWLWILYLPLIGVTIGVALSSGAMGAPVIFNANLYLGQEILSHFQEGVLMTAIFERGNILIALTSVMILLVEGYHFLYFYRDRITFFSAFVAVCTGFLFVFYYTPQILEFQARGESVVSDPLFQKAHLASEIDFKLFLAAAMLLLVRYLMRRLK